MSYAALCAYARMGPSRSLEKYRQAAGRLPAYLRHLERMSSRHGWQARVAAYDSAIEAEAEAERAVIRSARRKQLEESDWHHGAELRQACAAMLEVMPRFLQHTETEQRQDGELVKVITLALKAGPGEIARAMKLASDMQRMSLGEATERTEISGPNGGPIPTTIVYDYHTAIAGITAGSGQDSESPSENASIGHG